MEENSVIFAKNGKIFVNRKDRKNCLCKGKVLPRTGHEGSEGE
jgi:hypothetical protein